MSRADEMRILYHKKKYEVCFDEGIPDRKEERRNKLVYPEEIIGKKCGGCVRCEKKRGKETYHCMKLHYEEDITPDDKACTDYWDKAEENRLDKLHEADVEKRRKELWAIYAKREPIKLPLIHDGYGIIPECPICGEMPYSTEQCHWCGQRFIKDQEIEEYSKVDVESMNCPSCGAKNAFKYIKSRYNGHKHGECKVCGVRIIE